MKKYFIISIFLLFISSTFSFAQVDSSDLMNSIKQVGKQQKRLEKQQKKVERSNRKLEKQQKRLNRQNRKLNKENKRSNKEMREMERDQKKLEEAKVDSTSGSSLYDRKKLIFPNRVIEKSVSAVLCVDKIALHFTTGTLNRNYILRSKPDNYDEIILI